MVLNATVASENLFLFSAIRFVAGRQTSFLSPGVAFWKVAWHLRCRSLSPRSGLTNHCLRRTSAHQTRCFRHLECTVLSSSSRSSGSNPRIVAF